MRVDVCLVSWNRPKMTELVIKTLMNNTKNQNYRLGVVDNYSSPETVSMLTNLMKEGYMDELFLLGENKGLEYARTFLLDKFVGSDLMVCLDNDCLAPPIENNLDWSERLVDLMERYEDYAAISARTQVMIGTGNIFEEADKDGSEIVDFPHPGGSFRIMSTAAVAEAGGWRKDNPGRGQEERYICGKLREMGYKTAFAAKIHTLHLFGPAEITDRWGYDKAMKPEESGHSDIHHPALVAGDDPEEVKKYAGEENAKRYFA